MNFGEQLLKAYQLRNIESHNCKEWNNVRLYDELRNVLVIYLYTVHLHFKTLKSIVEPNDLTEYLHKQSQIFKVWQSRFVHIEGREEFAEVELYAKEVFEEIEEENENEPVKIDKKLEGVFVKVGDKAKIRIIKTGIQDDTNIEVVSGLKKGDTVITGPYTTVTKELNSGDKITTEKLEQKK